MATIEGKFWKFVSRTGGESTQLHLANFQDKEMFVIGIMDMKTGDYFNPGNTECMIISAEEMQKMLDIFKPLDTGEYTDKYVKTSTDDIEDDGMMWIISQELSQNEDSNGVLAICAAKHVGIFFYILDVESGKIKRMDKDNCFLTLHYAEISSIYKILCDAVEWAASE